MGKSNKWPWHEPSGYGELFYKRATGENEEMESSKALCKILLPLYEEGNKVADIACGAGHYLRSLRLRLDENIDYTGVDATKNYITYAKKAFPENAEFKFGYVTELPLKDSSFDIVMCNNLILHLPPADVQEAVKELMRTSKKYIVIRTIFGERNYIIKEVNDTSNGLDDYNYCNMYTEEYLQSMIQSIDPSADIKVITDDMWKDSFFDNRDETTVTGTIASEEYQHQVSGNLLLDWKFIVIAKH